MKPNSKKAKQVIGKEIFSEYSEAYVITNEDLRDAIQYVPEGATILTVAASGDHPMFFALKNPKWIDCFDISYNSKLVMDIKTAALQFMNRDEYVDLVCDLYYAPDKTNIQNMDKIIPCLSKDEQKYLKDMRAYQIFCNGSHPRTFSYLLPNETEYKQMQEMIKKPFCFMWTDIVNLRKYLNKTYDFMHLSNIFDYTTKSQTEDILSSLMKRSNPGCKIYFESYTYHRRHNDISLQEYCEMNAQKLNQKWKVKEAYGTKTAKYILHRVR